MIAVYDLSWGARYGVAFSRLSQHAETMYGVAEMSDETQMSDET